VKERAQEVSSQFDCSYDSAMQHYSYCDSVAKELDDLGFAARPRPRIEIDHESIYSNLKAGDYFDGRLPTVIRKLNLDQLSALYSLFSNWYGYVSYQFTMEGARRSEALRKKEFTWSMVREMKRIDPDTGKKRTEQQMSDSARNDIRFVEANANYERLNALHTVMEAVVLIAEQDLKTISREVTIKQTEIESQKLRVGGARHIDFTARQFPRPDRPDMTDPVSLPDQEEQDAARPAPKRSIWNRQSKSG